VAHREGEEVLRSEGVGVRVDRTEPDIDQKIVDICMELVKEEYAGTVQVEGIRWDYYYHPHAGSIATIAFCIKNGKAIIGIFAEGRLTKEEVEKKLWTN
jgi:hypothetical protein